MRKVILALFVAFSSSASMAVQFSGSQTGLGIATYNLTYDPFDNYAVCQATATITMTGLSGVIAAAGPTSSDYSPGDTNLNWTAQVLDGGTRVVWTHVGPGTGNYPVAKHVNGFTINGNSTSATAQFSTSGFARDGACPRPSLDISGTVPSPQGVPVTAQAITFGTAPAPTYSPSGSFQVTASASSGLAVSFSSLTASVCNTSSTSSPAAVSILTAGTCTIAANQVGNSNYSAAPQTTQSVSIAKANQTITWSSLNSLQVGANGTLSASGGASGSAIVFTSATPAVCTVAGSNVTAVTAGTCVLAADQAGNTNYNAAPQATASLTVISAAPTSIPTLSEWGMIILSGLMALGAFMVMRRRPS